MYTILNEKQFKKLEKLYYSYLKEILKEANISRKVPESKKERNPDDELEIYCLSEPVWNDFDPKDFKGAKREEGGYYNYMPFIPYNILCQLSIEQIQELIKVTGREVN